MGPPALTETTIRYLFATNWLPCDTKGAHLDAEPELTNAAMVDCLQTVADAHQPSLGD